MLKAAKWRVERLLELKLGNGGQERFGWVGIRMRRERADARDRRGMNFDGCTGIEGTSGN